MYFASNDKNVVVMFCVSKGNHLDKPRFMADCRLRNPAIYQTQTLMTNITKLTKLITANPIWSKIDLADEYLNIRVEESSEKYNTNQTACHKI